MKTKHISTFLFRKAEYDVSDQLGNQLSLKVDYWNSRFSIKVLKKSLNGIDQLKYEAATVAHDLLKRKHKVNFAQKE